MSHIISPNDACTHRTRSASTLPAASRDTHEPHIIVQIASSTYPEPPGAGAETKDIARTDLRRAQQHTLINAQAAADSGGGSGASSHM